MEHAIPDASGHRKISLIVPVYNAEAYLPAMARSVLEQDWEDFQIIFSDDGSTDASPAILGELAARDPRVTVVSGENAGVSTARNRALAAAEGALIGFADSDDLLLPGYFRTLAGLLEEYDADAACCGFRRVYAASGVSDRMPPDAREIQVTDRDGFFAQMLRPDGYAMVIWNKLFRREALLDETGALLQFDPALHIVEDGEFQFRTRVRRAVFTPEPLYEYTVRTTGAMYGAVTPRKLTELAAREKIVELCRDASPEVQNLARMKYQKGVRDLLFHAVITGSRDAVKPCFPALKTYRRELFSSPFLSKKEKLKYHIYLPMIRLNLRRTGAFLMEKLSGH